MLPNDPLWLEECQSVRARLTFFCSHLSLVFFHKSESGEMGSLTRVSRKSNFEMLFP